MIDFKTFKDGKKGAVTLSYDDGAGEDYKLVPLLNKYGLKATFHLNSARLENRDGSVVSEDVKGLFKGHEVSAHTVNHPWLDRVPQMTVINQTLKDREALERLCGYVVRGMSYPFGAFNDEVAKTLKSCGILYSRTVNSTNGFWMPTDFLKWNPSCHHNTALPLCDKFEKQLEGGGCSLFYIWGHSYEFTNNSEHGWEYMEQLCKRISALADKVWLATNIEIYDYVTAQKSLHISADESMAYNGSATDVWVNKDHKPVKIPAGQTVVF